MTQCLRRFSRTHSFYCIGLFVSANAIFMFVDVRSTFAQPLNATAQTQAIPEGVRKIADIEYVQGGHARHRLDLYLPENIIKSVPVVVWVHGGGWAGGDKSRTPAAFLATRGFAVASVNYRFSQHAVSTLTTVGYGDVYPITVGGKIFTFVILILGLGFISVPAGLVASALGRARQIEEEEKFT
jgi:Ion channel/Carboxylesterase family